ncbi:MULTISPECIES: hypothetical protein [Oceanobacillus]|uniref:Uncharacterized protein n=1 Tax=Oceanobacillus kimchii TaxID=746691 RepID=A0ABQ5TH64_9BACI|nr:MULTISPECIES: hypothetical protein [Oceanobacillus]MBT2599287.1 hypothetical protein [Oceanobacillus sp. ISL-74]MBT2652205.1 hypothetical protein [Oceanobacillus sp. ISL-73]OEH54157.1 hypothetical protein AQ616_10355 [Oceanobacillus sp. E9]GLO65452.1 hypothetical protein MACH08_12360 [Oceanobacillus kimchii]
MNKEITLQQWKSFVEQKINKKLIIKMLWNEREKMTLLLVPNMKINSVIHDDNEGYLFYDIAGKHVNYPIPSILPDNLFIDGKINLAHIKSGYIQINQEPLSKKDIQLLENK